MAKKRYKILVVDDLPDWRRTLSRLLGDAGYEVEVAESSANALLLFEKTQFDLAVLDIRLIDSDEENEEGINLATEIKRRRPEVKVIQITGYGTEKRMKRAMEPEIKTGLRPADNYLPKNKIDDELVQTIQQMLPE